MSLHVVLGKGPVGSTLTGHLRSQGHTVRVLSRSGATSTDGGHVEGVEHVALDAADARAVTAASQGRRALQLREPGVPPVGDGLATDGRVRADGR